MQYRCSICGYVYDEDKESVPFADLPEDWKCPWCGAPKALFEPVGAAPPVQAEPEPAPAPEPPADVPDMSMTKLSVGQMAALCSNLARGCEKQYMPAEMALFNELADWFTRRVPPVEDATVEAVAAQLKQDIADYADVRKTGEDQADRGAQRVCVWGEKVTRILQSLVGRYLRDGDALLEDTEIWVCSVCGFVYIGQDAPELCPVCKVPSWKFNKVDRRKQS